MKAVTRRKIICLVHRLFIPCQARQCVRLSACRAAQTISVPLKRVTSLFFAAKVYSFIPLYRNIYFCNYLFWHVGIFFISNRVSVWLQDRTLLNRRCSEVGIFQFGLRNTKLS